MSVDKPTGTVYLGDYGPDAGTANAGRGPAGQVEFNRITKAGNYGWPYCTGDNSPYVDYNFANSTSGATFSCTAPKNTSPNNTGLTDLPPAQPAWIPYDGGSVPEFGGGSESPMDRPVYRYDAASTSTVKFPQSFDGDYFAGECGRKWIKRIEQSGDGAVQSIHGHRHRPRGRRDRLLLGEGHLHHRSRQPRSPADLGHRLLRHRTDRRRRRARPQREHLRRLGRRVHRQGAGGQPALTTHDQNISQGGKRQAEHFGGSAGVTIVDKATGNGGRTVGYVDDGDWISFTPYVLGNATKVTARVSSGGAGGTLEVRTGSPTGTLLGSAAVPVTGGWDTFRDVSADLTNRPAATTTLYLVFTGGSGSLFDLDDFTFTTSGATAPGGESRGSAASARRPPAERAPTAPATARARRSGWGSPTER